MFNVTGKPRMSACQSAKKVEEKVAEYDTGTDGKKRKRNRDNAVSRENADDNCRGVFKEECSEGDRER